MGKSVGYPRLQNGDGVYVAHFVCFADKANLNKA